MKELLLLIALLIFAIPDFAQDTTAYTEMSYDEMVKKINTSNDWKIVFSNVKFIFKKKPKLHYLVRQNQQKKHPLYKQTLNIGNDKVESIYFKNCRFESFKNAKNLTTELYLNFETRFRISFTLCKFTPLLVMKSNESKNILEFTKCHFKQIIRINNKKGSVYVKESDFSHKYLKANNKIDADQIYLYSIKIPDELSLNLNWGGIYSINSNSSIIINTEDFSSSGVSFAETVFKRIDIDIKNLVLFKTHIQNLNVNAVSSLIITNSEIDTISLDNTLIKEKLFVDSTKFNIVGLSYTKLPTDNMDLPFNLIKDGKVSVLGKPKTPYNLNTMDTLYNASVNRSLASIYQKLLNGYKTNGDKKSFNQCFVEYKIFETKTLMQDYKTNPSFELWFQIQLNKFLRIFSAYGTSPARALIYSFWVILIFSLIYFVFPSEEDNLTKQRLQKKLERLINYFTSEKGLSEIEIEEKKHIIGEIERFKKNYESAKGKIPWLLSKLGKPIYILSLAYLKISLWFLNQIDISNGIWKELPPKRKLFGNILITFYFFIYFFWGILIRTLNSLTLSMNAFVTLGFGELQARGISRYFAIAEGLIGWFLLSIFSVSLINQVLQL